MEITFWGVRGSAPVCGRSMVEYGGHTPCASIITSEEHLIILDAGTGIIPLGMTLEKRTRKRNFHIHLVLTHFHIDHTVGILFFAPLYSKKVEMTFYSPLKPEETQKMLRLLMGGRFFPVDFNQTKSKKHFKQVPSGDFNIGNIRISHIPLHHPQGSLAYRFHEKEKSVVFATDTEHPEKGVDKRLVAFAREADIFVYDSTFTPEEYNQDKKGWGHSTWLEGTRVAEQANVKKLYLSHFNPSHSDEKIGMIINYAQKEFQETYGAKEGLTIRL
jgi:phosphoribosyl 1,2-cyclic phosphodiesterase